LEIYRLGQGPLEVLALDKGTGDTLFIKGDGKMAIERKASR
jgi:hypothetical protein